MKHLISLALLSLAIRAAAAPAAATADISWPRVIPCRVADGTNRDLLVMTLGNVETPVADGVFDPIKDQITLNNGAVISNYYRDTLGVKFYQPLDKSRFPAPPSGWCTWYYYYNRINEAEVKGNARWIAENLKDYGAESTRTR